MPDTEQAYVDTLAHQLHCRHADLLATAEDDIAVLRARIALAVAFINNPDYDRTARITLARLLGLPDPATPKGGTPA